MAVLEANGTPIPAAPDPQSTPTSTETPSAPLPINFGTKTSRSRPVRVRRDPGTLIHVPPSTQHHHGKPPSSHDVSIANQPSTLSLELRRKSAQQQQLTKEHHRCSLPQQLQTKGHHHRTNAQRMSPTNRPELHKNESQENNNDNLFNGIYTTGNQLQHAIKTDYPECFTPTVHDSRNQYSPPNLPPRSYNSKIPIPITNQQRTTTNNHDLFTPPKGDPSHNHHRSNQTHMSKPHDNLFPKPPHPTTSTPIPANWSNNIPALNSIATPIYNRSRIVRVRRKGDTAKPRNPKQLSIPASTAAHGVLSRAIDWQGHRKDQLMHHLNSQTASTNSTSPASTTAFTRHTNDAKILTPQQNLPTGPTMTASSSKIICNQHNVNTATQQQSDSEDIPTRATPSRNNSEPSVSKPQTDNDLQLYPTPYSREYRYKNFRNTHDTTPAQPGSIWHHRIRYQYYRYQLQNTHLQRRPTEPLRSHPPTHNEAVGISTTPTTSTATYMTQRYTIDTTTAPLPVLLWYQTHPLNVYLYDAGRPGPPWPPPTHNNKLLRVLSMSDTKDPLSTVPGFQQYPTDIRHSRTIRNKQLHPTDPTQLQADKIRATLRTHDIRQHFIRNIGPQPSTSDKNLLRPP